MDNERINQILKNVFKPARYTGGEYNCAQPKAAGVKYAFAFPDTYEVGMSHLGMKILYGLLNDMDGVSCERVFAPFDDMARALAENDLPLFSLESHTPLCAFDFVGFSIQYELCLTTVLYMLELGRIPVKASDRTLHDPIVMAGGPCCVNPEPFRDFFDIIIVGEAEEVLPKLVRLREIHPDRASYLKAAKELTGVYVPALHKQGETVTRAYIADMDGAYYPKTVIVPFLEPVHDRLMLEVMRGCPRGCRFCQAGFIYRPARTKSVETLKNQADSLIAETGYEEISLSSLSATDYRGCEALIGYLTNRYEDEKLSVSLPSLRIDVSNIDIMKQVKKFKPGTLTFAPEAGSQRMRDVINKNVTERDILDTLEKAFAEGFTKIKLYFMFGLPYETDEDLWAIGDLVKKILDLFNARYGTTRPIALSVSASCFVPKPFTPFQYFPQCSRAEIEHKTDILKRAIPRRVKLSYNDSTLCALEAAFARGDAGMNAVIEAAHRLGCVFDAWPEHYDEQKWRDAFAACGYDLDDCAQKAFAFGEALPWDFIDIGVARDFFEKEAQRAQLAATTPNCFERCSACGIQKTNGGCRFDL